MQFMNTDIKNNEWTGVGFGDDKVRKLTTSNAVYPRYPK